MRFEEAFRDELAQLDKEAGIRSLGRNALLATVLAFSGHGGKPSPHVSSPPAATAKSGDSGLARKMDAQVRQGMTQSERAAGAAKEKVSGDKKEAVRARWEAKADKEHIERKENRRVGDDATWKRYLTYQGALDNGVPPMYVNRGLGEARRTALNLEKPESSKRPMVSTFEGIPAGKKKTWNDMRYERGSQR